MMKCKYVALSKTQDECTICNRIWNTYALAAEYARLVEKNSGCILYVIAVGEGTDKDLDDESK